VVTTSTPERQEGLVLLQQAINKIEETIRSLGGSFSVQMAVKLLFYIWCIFIIIHLDMNGKKFILPSKFQPKVVTALDEAELARQMEKAELENFEVDGDDDDEDDENGEHEDDEDAKDEDENSKEN